MRAEVRVAGLILAGGAGRRMGGVDKAGLPLAGRPLLEHVRGRLAPQVGALAIAAGPDPARFAGSGLPALRDPVADAGPLCGLLAGLDWAAAQGAWAVATAPVDSPFLPLDLVARLAERGGAALAATEADDGGLRDEGGFGLWPVTLAGPLRVALEGGMRRVRDFADAAGAARVRFADRAAFANINRPADLAAAEARLAGGA